MQCSITEVEVREGGRPGVALQSAIGPIRAVWAGGAFPKSGMSVHVEFDLEPSEVVVLAPEEGVACAELAESGTTLSGCVESRHSDGMVFVRFASDCLCMLQWEEQPLRPGEWVRLTLPLGCLVVWPMGY